MSTPSDMPVMNAVATKASDGGGGDMSMPDVLSKDCLNARKLSLSSIHAFPRPRPIYPHNQANVTEGPRSTDRCNEDDQSST